MVIAEIVSVITYLVSVVLLGPTYFDVQFMSTWEFFWKTVLTTAVSALPPCASSRAGGGSPPPCRRRSHNTSPPGRLVADAGRYVRRRISPPAWKKLQQQ